MQTYILLRDGWGHLDPDWLFDDLKHEYGIVVMFKKRIFIVENKKPPPQTLNIWPGHLKYFSDLLFLEMVSLSFYFFRLLLCPFWALHSQLMEYLQLNF